MILMPFAKFWRKKVKNYHYYFCDRQFVDGTVFLQEFRQNLLSEKQPALSIIAHFIKTFGQFRKLKSALYSGDKQRIIASFFHVKNYLQYIALGRGPII